MSVKVLLNRCALAISSWEISPSFLPATGLAWGGNLITSSGRVEPGERCIRRCYRGYYQHF